MLVSKKMSLTRRALSELLAFGVPLAAKPVLIRQPVFRETVPRPQAEALLEPVLVPGPIGAHRFAKNGRARLALLVRQTVEPLDVVIGQIGEDACHCDIPISYRDIMSIISGRLGSALGTGSLSGPSLYAIRQSLPRQKLLLAAA